MSCNDKPSVSGEIRAVQAELAELREAGPGPAVPRTSRWAGVQQSRWTPAAVAAIIASAVPLVQQWRSESAAVVEARECAEASKRLEARMTKLERRLNKQRR
jgi:uncharacterized protein YceH (UPF0502 family)